MTMRILRVVCVLSRLVAGTAFLTSSVRHYPINSRTLASSVFSQTEEASLQIEEVAAPTKTKTLGLVTFDLDDTLYSISRVVESANSTFLKIFSWKYVISDYFSNLP